MLLYFSVKNIGETTVPSGKYTISKWITLNDLPTVFHVSPNTWQYKLWLKYFAPTLPKIQAGTFEVERATSLVEVFSTILTKPIQSDLTITILPGWNIYDIDAYLSGKKIIETWAFLIAARDHFSTFQSKYPYLVGKLSLEWFLYPDTYRILPTADAYMIIDRLLSEFDKKIWASYTSLGGKAYETLILSSIVEREERKPTEKATVADILAKRVREGIPMGADATVCYPYAKTQKQCTPEFIASVIGKKDDYNTRNKQWYIPTPISSISLETWNAVIADAPSPYYYYLHDMSGNIHYGRTLAEHNTNKVQYLK